MSVDDFLKHHKRIVEDLQVEHNAKEKGFSETIHRKNLVIQAGERKLEQKLQELEQKLSKKVVLN